MSNEARSQDSSAETLGKLEERCLLVAGSPLSDSHAASIAAACLELAIAIAHDAWLGDMPTHHAEEAKAQEAAKLLKLLPSSRREYNPVGWVDLQKTRALLWGALIHGVLTNSGRGPLAEALLDEGPLLSDDEEKILLRMLGKSLDESEKGFEAAAYLADLCDPVKNLSSLPVLQAVLHRLVKGGPLYLLHRMAHVDKPHEMVHASHCIGRRRA